MLQHKLAWQYGFRTTRNAGSEIEIVTAPGKGTNITVTIPVGEAKQLTEEADGFAGQAEQAGVVHENEKTIVRRVLVVDDHKIVREGLVGLMQIEPDIQIVGQAADGPQAIELAEQLQPDVVIMDVNLGQDDRNRSDKTHPGQSPEYEGHRTVDAYGGRSRECHAQRRRSSPSD